MGNTEDCVYLSAGLVSVLKVWTIIKILGFS